MVEANPTRRGHRLRLVEYPLPGNWKALVDRTDADNDYLSLKVARPDDWWFHVRDLPGGHVVLQGPPGEEPDRETLKRARLSQRTIAKVEKGPWWRPRVPGLVTLAKPGGRKRARCKFASRF